ncbi:translocation/assembly module TamB domain-containing protein [Agrobacterium sp. rho-13.3]|uniref:translocation/assembly module TamB domain-containing protein n=1 Tax=Agrobacterium sp. rho-13.3 TaxID=3072980 RepID=UPI002A12A177|nr:translocation/assembly module TamB domain-containing protein [Agrobacterium sp. rho-13.3]MDX8311102.1 translocation/assembly module TamB domain-containing protein [Agrobacterium sp. rho-13.3]
MTALIRLLKWFVYIALGSVGLLMLAVLFIGFTPTGARFAADKISALVSTPDQTIELSTPTGLLTGDLRLGSVVLSDREGVYARLGGIEVDWTPLSLLRGTFHAERIAAGSVEFDRLPLPPTEPSPETSSGFSLPVNVAIDSLSLPDISLGEKLAGRRFELAATGNGTATSNTIALSLSANRKDEPRALVTADIAFVPNENVLKLDAALNEPQGGLLATLLRLPDAPAVALNVNGEGPLSNWTGKVSGAVAGNKVLDLTGLHQLAADGTRRVELHGGGRPDMLLPPLVRQLFAGQTKLDLAATLTPEGRVSVESGNLETGKLLLTASGVLDPQGQNDLAANLIGTNGPVDIRFPLDGGDLNALVNGIDLTLRGNARAARLNMTTSLRSLDIPQGRFDEVKVSATSDDLNLASQTGTVKTSVSVAQSAMTSSDLERAIKAPLKLNAPLRISPQNISFEGATLESASIGGTGSGTYDLSARNIATNLRLFILPSVLPPALAEKFDTTIAVDAYVNSTIGGATRVENLVVKSGTVEANGNVALENGNVVATLGGRLPALEKLTPQAAGALGFSLEANGPLTAADFKVSLNSAKATLAGRALEALKVSANGKADLNAPQAQLQASGSLDGQVIDASAQLLQAENGTAIPQLNVTVGRNVLTGNLQFTPQFLPSGTLSFDFPDVSLLAALAAQQANGDVKGDVALSNADGKIAATIRAISGTIGQGTTKVSKLVADLKIDDLVALAANGKVTAETINAGAANISSLNLDINHAGTATAFDLTARYDNAPLVLKGSADTGAAPMTVKVDAFSASPLGIPVKLAQPTSIAINNGTARIAGLTIQTGNGRVDVNGTAGSALDINATIRALPASLANAFSPGLDAAGTISGTITAKGASADPSVDYDLTWADAAVSQTRAAGLDALGIKANGRFAGGTLRLDTSVTAQGGLALSGGGTLGISGNRPLSMAFKGNLPFGAVAAQTAAQGFDVAGSAAIDVKIEGTASAPIITGGITTNGTRVTDVRRNLTVNNLGAAISFDRDRATISRLTGQLAGGGTISGSGTIGITPGSGFPADITITLNRAAYNDGTLFTTNASGTLTLKGPALNSPVLGGTITLEKSAITIPERLPASLAQIDMKHKNAPAAVRLQQQKLNADKGGSGSSSPITLDLQVNAPSGIFVRGRGIDAELTGSLTVKGTAVDPVVSGGFEMKRGRLEILTRRLDFTTGDITFGGGLVPVLNMAAESTAGSTTVTISVTGNANDPAFAFTSSPALPQDEVMAQLIFGQSMSKLSALQIARLADAAGQLAGGRSTSLFDSLRSNLGIDDLDISTDSEGQARVSAGKYLNERTYLELQQSGSSGAKAIINLDVGRGVKLRGEAGGDGEGAAGIFYEKEY